MLSRCSQTRSSEPGLNGEDDDIIGPVNSSSYANSSRHPWRLAIIGGLISIIIWALFKFVVTDSTALLEYLKVLVWPIVVLGGLAILRDPIVSKMNQLLNIDVMGVKAGFSQTQADRELERDLRGPINRLVGVDKPHETLEEVDDPSADESQATPVPEPGPSEADRSDVFDAFVEPDEDSMGAPVSDQTRTLNAHEKAQPATAERPDALIVDGRILSALERSSGIKSADRTRTINERLNRVHNRVMMLNARAYRADREQQALKNSAEEIVRRSAEWGYDVAKAGGKRAVPDIEWQEEGGWRIVSEVPAGRENDALDQSVESRRIRHITRLEQEIQNLEKERANAVGLTGPGNYMVLQKYKNTLQDMDPGNPFAR